MEREITEMDVDIQKALTQTTDVPDIIPEIWSQTIEETAQERRVMRGLVVLNTDLLDKPGDIAHVPKMSSLTAITLTEDVAIDPESMSTDEVQLIPTEVGAGVEITRKTLRRAYINVMEEATKELGNALAQKEDRDIITAAVAGAGSLLYPDDTYTTIDDITADDIFTVSLFKDAINILEGANAPTPYRCLIHPAIKRSLMEDSQFVDASQYGGAEVIRTGEIGSYLGVSIFMSTNAPTEVNAGTIKVYTTLFWGARGIAHALKANPDFQEDYDPLKRTHVVASVMEYQAKVLNDYQVVVVKSAGGAAPAP